MARETGSSSTAAAREAAIRARGSRRFWNAQLGDLYSAAALPTISEPEYPNERKLHDDVVVPGRGPGLLPATVSLPSDPHPYDGPRATTVRSYLDVLMGWPGRPTPGQQRALKKEETKKKRRDKGKKNFHEKVRDDHDGYIVSRKFRVRPSPEQRGGLLSWFSTSRKSYNATIALLKEDSRTADPVYTSLDSVVSYFRSEGIELLQSQARDGWMTDIPRHVFLNGVREAYQAHKAAEDKEGQHSVSFRTTRGRSSESILLESDRPGAKIQKKSPLKNLYKRSYWRNVLHAGAVLSTKGFPGGGDLILVCRNPKALDHWLALETRQTQTGPEKLFPEASRLVFDRATRPFFLVLSKWVLNPAAKVDKEKGKGKGKKEKGSKSEISVVGLDPGIKTPLAYLDPISGAHGKAMHGFGDGWKQRTKSIEKLQRRIRTYRMEKSGRRARRQRWKMKRTLRRKEVSRRNWRRAQHDEAASFLCSNWDVVLFPWLQVKEMLKRSGHLWGSTRAKLRGIAHGLLRGRVENCARKHGGAVKLKLTREPGTSKTCSRCGHWQSSLTLSDRAFVCANPECKLVAERDLNGARNNSFAAIGDAHQVPWDGRSG